MTPILTKRARRAPPPVSRIAAGVFAGLARKTKYVEPSLAARWPEIVGADLARLARPGRLSGPPGARHLEVYAPSGAAAAELQMRQGDLMEKLSHYYGPGGLSRIVIRQHAAASEQRKQGDGALGAALANFRAAVNQRSSED